MELIFKLGEIGEASEKLMAALASHSVIAMHGEMGAGKTTFIHALCTAMGVSDVVTSPTFSIINQYKTAHGQTVYHIDLYRIRDEAEAIQAGVEDCLYSGFPCLVEWPEKAPGIFPEDTLHVFITSVDPDTRKLKIKL
jgi:tRNA threonylcarbamoyladenosine biosynthesis protein TsaE